MIELPRITSKEEDKIFLKTVANNVKRIRLIRGLSQLETALSIGQKSQGFYACMENGINDKHFNLLHLFKLSRLFEVDIKEFFIEKDQESLI